MENETKTPSPTALGEISDERRVRLQNLHGPLQKRLFLFAGPLSIGAYLYGLWEAPVWQNAVMLAVVVALFAAWGVALQLTRKGRLEASVYTFMISVFAFEGTEMMFKEGTEATSMIALFAVMAYGALYTRRYLIQAGVAVAALVVVSELAKFLDLYGIYVEPPASRITGQVAFALLLTPLVVYILRKGQTISESMYDEVRAKSRSQAQIIAAATRVQPVIDRVAGQLQEVAEGFVAQSTEHASTTNEVTVTIGHIMESAGQSSSAAGKAKAIAESTRADSVRTRDRILEVQRGFSDVAQAIQASLTAINELSRRAENIEEILGYNRELGEHIKVLAVNAAIEAASAGEYGRGFRVVADELREMIVKTDANLKRSTELLGAIMTQAKENAASTQKSAETIAHYFRELQATGELIESITESFVVTSGQVGKIAEAAQMQVVSIDQVRLAMDQIDAAAGQLGEAARLLVASVKEIVSSHEDLRAVLGRSE